MRCHISCSQIVCMVVMGFAKLGGKAIKFAIVFLVTVKVLVWLCRIVSSNIYAKDNLSNYNVSDVMLIVRTSKSNYHKRLLPMIDTWFRSAGTDVHVITDVITIEDYKKMKSLANVHWHPSSCPGERSLRGLCCKTGFEFELMQNANSSKKWFCRFDDDQYVNTRRLVEYLSGFDHRSDYYIGRASTDYVDIRRPIKLRLRFLTYGAGVCYSRSLITRIGPLVTPISRMVNGCTLQLREFFGPSPTTLPKNARREWRLPDDMYVGKLIISDLGVQATHAAHFHSHLPYKDNLSELLRNGEFKTINETITFGFNDKSPAFPQSSYANDTWGVRMFHCALFPSDFDCPKRIWEALKGNKALFYLLIPSNVHQACYLHCAKSI